MLYCCKSSLTIDVIGKLTPIMEIIILSLNLLIKSIFFYHKTISGCSKKTKRGRTGSSQMLNYLSRKHENSMQIKERRLNLEERKLQLEEKKMALEEMKWKMMMSCHAMSCLVMIKALIIII